MNVFNRGEIAPSYTKCNRTPSSREQQARELAQALAGCKIKPTVVPGFEGVKPLPPRTNWRDPEARLKRKAYGVSTTVRREIERRDAERAHIRKMVESLGLVE
jgi:hypothetical protein